MFVFGIEVTHAFVAHFTGFAHSRRNPVCIEAHFLVCLLYVCTLESGKDHFKGLGCEALLNLQARWLSGGSKVLETPPLAIEHRPAHIILWTYRQF